MEADCKVGKFPAERSFVFGAPVRHSSRIAHCAYCAPKTKEHSAGDYPTLQSASKRAQVNLVDVLDAAQVGRQSKGSVGEVGFTLADELNHDARQSTYEVEIEGVCV